MKAAAAMFLRKVTTSDAILYVPDDQFLLN